MKQLEKKEERSLFIIAQAMAVYYLVFGWGTYLLLDPTPVAGVSKLSLPVFLTALAAFMAVMACIQFKQVPAWVRLMTKPFAAASKVASDLRGSLGLETR